jgi:hypothetical protein
MDHEQSALAVPLSGALTRCTCPFRRHQTDKMDFLYIFMNHLCPSIGAVIALMMFASPMKAVLRANNEKSLGVRGWLAKQKPSAAELCLWWLFCCMTFNKSNLT